MAKKRCRANSDTNLLPLPTDVILLILKQLNQDDLLIVSLVSKSFRSLTDELVRKLTFKRLPSVSDYRKIFTRFSSVNQLTLCTSSITRALTAIADSGLEIERLGLDRKPCLSNWERMLGLLSKRLGFVKSLKLRWSWNGSGLSVVDFIHLFPSLEELDLDLSRGKGWTDAGIENLVLNAPCLRKINLDYNEDLTDRSLVALANSANLEHLSCNKCTHITAGGFCAFVCKMKSLKSLVVPPDYYLSIDYARALAETISKSDRLSHITLNRTLMEDVFLSVIASSRSPLTSIECNDHLSNGYTMNVLSPLFHAFQGLTRLRIHLPWFKYGDTQDKEMRELVKCLPRLKDVSLFSTPTLYETLFSLIHNCSLLEFICMKSVEISPRCQIPDQLTRKNYNIRSIAISPQPSISLKLKKALESICPSLKIITIR